MNEKISITVYVALAILIFCVFLLVGSVVYISFVTLPKTVPEVFCQDLGGTWVFYECQDVPSSPCSELRTGYWCNFKNGSVSETDIWRKINSTEWATP